MGWGDRRVAGEGLEHVRVRRMRRRRALIAGSALGVAVVLGGCESAADPTPSATTTPSATPSSSSPTSPASSPSPTPTETSTIPAAARQNTPEGAEAFVKYFMDQVNVAWTTPQSGVIAAESTRNCEFCATTERRAEYLVNERQRYADEPVSVRSVQALSGAPEGQMYLASVLIQNASEVVDERGRVVASDEREVLRRNIALRWEEGRWMMLAVEKTS